MGRSLTLNTWYLCEKVSDSYVPILSITYSLSIKQANDLLDKVAMGNVEHKKADTRSALQILLRNTSALEQVLN
jgi:predicted nucleotidyltransferase